MLFAECGSLCALRIKVVMAQAAVLVIKHALDMRLCEVLISAVVVREDTVALRVAVGLQRMALAALRGA